MKSLFSIIKVYPSNTIVRQSSKKSNCISVTGQSEWSLFIYCCVRSLSIDFDNSLFVLVEHTKLGSKFSNVDNSETARDIAAKLGGPIMFDGDYLPLETSPSNPRRGDGGGGEGRTTTPKITPFPAEIT